MMTVCEHQPLVTTIRLQAVADRLRNTCCPVCHHRYEIAYVSLTHWELYCPQCNKQLNIEPFFFQTQKVEAF